MRAKLDDHAFCLTLLCADKAEYERAMLWSCRARPDVRVEIDPAGQLPADETSADSDPPGGETA